VARTARREQLTDLTGEAVERGPAGVIGGADGEDSVGDLDERELMLRADREDLRFLGREFLTWLVFHVDQGGGTFGKGEMAFAVGFGEKLLLRSVGTEVGEARLKGGAPADSLDVRFAVAGGLSVREADLVLVRGDRTFELTLGADAFDLRSVKLPETVARVRSGDADGGRGGAGGAGSDDELAAEDRLALLDELDECLGVAFAHFLDLRMKKSWEKEMVPALAEWLRAALEG
jgi:hypothetical protein